MTTSGEDIQELFKGIPELSTVTDPAAVEAGLIDEEKDWQDVRRDLGSSMVSGAEEGSTE